MVERVTEEDLQHYPTCTCGKCIVRRLRSRQIPSFPYGKDIGSVYGKDFRWIDPLKLPEITNKSKQSGFGKQYREHLPTALMSTHKFDYRPFKIQPKEITLKQSTIESGPFFGKSTYNCTYFDWGSSNVGKNTPLAYRSIGIPLRGDSNYKESYPRYPEDTYRVEKGKDKAKDTLNFYGKLIPESIMKRDYKPIDFSQPHYFNKDKIKRNEIEKSSMIPAPFPKSNFESNYVTSYVDLSGFPCKLRDYLNHRQVKYLEI